MGNFILRLPGNIEESLVISTQELTKDISHIFSLLSIDAHKGGDQDGIHDTKDNGNDDSTIDDIKQGPYQHVYFSTRALILSHYGIGTLISQPIFELFQILYSPVHKFNLFICIYSCALKYLPVLCLVFFCICPINSFSIFTSQKSSLISREFLCRPLNNKGWI